MHLALFFLFLVAACSGNYVNRGAWIVNKTDNTRLHLKCLNWYGAHMESFVVAGLHVRGVKDLVDTFASTGANCVRLPVSIDLIAQNPVVEARHISSIRPGECNSTHRALDVMDCVVYYLQKRNILLIFNSHTSMAGWVGPGQKVSQGLWNLGGNYSTMDWIRSMEVLVSRYDMFGFDLRNEIHDQDNVVITWGKSNDINTDWLAASSLASERLRSLNDELFIIVGGLCWNLDLRPMMRLVGPAEPFSNGKLIYTAHIYSWSFWWHLDVGMFDYVFNACVVFFILSVAFSLMCAVNYFHRLRYYLYKSFDDRVSYYDWMEFLYYFVSTSFILHALWLALGCVFIVTARNGGCSTMADDAWWLIVIESILFSLTFLMFLYGVSIEISVLAWLFMWCALFFLSIFSVLAYLKTDGAVEAFMGMWDLENRPVPVWIGEFGTGLPGTNHLFDVILDYVISKYNLDFAYWTFNGDNFRFGKFSKEGFGIVEPDYVTIKNYTNVFRTLFG